MMPKGKRILLIGGAGFIGSYIVDQLVEEDPEEIIVLDNFVRGKRENLEKSLGSDKVRIVEGTMTDKQQLRDAMDGVDAVFLLAALWLGECVSEPRDAADVNIMGTYNVIEACRDLEIKRVVFSSSASVYGNALAVPMTEEHPFNNRTMYGATKIAGEQIFRSFNDMYGLDYVGLRYMNVYGPRMDDKGTYVSVIVKVLDRMDQGLPPLIFGDGSQAYDFIHVEDVAAANICALKGEATDEFFNVGTGTKTSINELVNMLIEITGSSLKPEFRPQEQMFVTHRVGSTDKIEKLLDFYPKIELLDGLKSVVNWWKETKGNP